MAKATITIDMENPAFRYGFYGTVLVLREDGDCHTVVKETGPNRNAKGNSRYFVEKFTLTFKCYQYYDIQSI